VVEQSVLACEGGLTGKRITIDGLGDVLSDALVRIIRLDRTEQTIRLSAREPAFTIEAVPGHMEVAMTYTALGIEHILLGVDHLLFVLALLIIVRSGRRLMTTITAFTLAHSITLAAATLGLVHVPSPPVEAIIALSIVFVAAEIVHGHLGKPGLTARKPWIVAFTFGLLHGFGFAGALSEVGLPQHAIPIALLFFNVGVEIGQLLFISVVLTVMLIVQRTRLRAPAWAWRLPPYAIGGIAAFWVIQRIAIF
jgi:hydrogenase/urease accessory protein HupE